MPADDSQEVVQVLTPMLCVRDAAEAITWYEAAFGAEELPGRLNDAEGKVAHAEFRTAGALVMIADHSPGFNHTPEQLGGSPILLHLMVPDVDAFCARAEAAGAEVLCTPEDRFYGHRAGRLLDPYGFTWAVATPIEQVSIEEMQHRFGAMQGASG